MEDKTKDVKSSTRPVITEVKSNSDKTNAMDVEHAQLDKTLLETNARSQDQHVPATKNTTKPLIHVCNVLKVNYQEMDLVNKTEDAKFSNSHVTQMVKFNLIKTNATLAKHAPIWMKLSLVTDVLLELHAHAIKSITQQPTLAEPAQQVNLLMPLLEDANHSTLVATEMEEFNCHKTNAINAESAQLVNNLEPPTHALSQDQTAHATNLLTQTTNVKPAQLDNWLMQTIQDVHQEPTPVIKETKLEETNSAAMHAKLAVNSKCQTLKELNVWLDHLWTADVWAEEIALDTNASHAQLDKSLMPIMSTNASLNQLVINSHTDLLEMLPHAEDAKDATGHNKSQTQSLVTDVFKDQDLNAAALKDMETKDTHALSAHSVKLEAQLTKNNVFPQLNAQEPIKFNLVLMLHHAVDARLANGQDSSQMFQELNALQDHLPFAQIALPDNHKMDTPVTNAQLAKFKIQTTSRDAIPQLALDNTKSDSLLTTSAVELVRLANGHNINQILKEANAFLDQELFATVAILDNQMMDTHVLLAQLDQSKIQTILKFATHQLAMVFMIFNYQSTTDHVVNAKHALSQDRFQTMKELLVSTDHLLNAQTASPRDQLTTTHANSAHSDKFKTQLTWIDVLQEPVMDKDKSNLVLITKTVENVRPANGHNSCQMSPRLNALLDHLPFAIADRDNHKMDIHANNAQLDKFKVWPTKNNVLDQTVVDNTKSNFHSTTTTVEDVRLANGHNSHQTHRRLNASQDH